MLNREYRFVFQPLTPHLVYGRRFGIGAGKLAEYIGEKNAQDVLKRAAECTNDKMRRKFRATGIVDVYLK